MAMINCGGEESVCDIRIVKNVHGTDCAGDDDRKGFAINPPKVSDTVLTSSQELNPLLG
jgi:hypothetical protein